MTPPTTAAPPRISVVIPTYNAAARLRRTIGTVLAQTVPAHEIIVVDDGSTDATPEVCAGFGAALRVLRVPNGGQQRARNLAVEQATGDWIALLDHDDWWDPEYLAEIGALVVAHDIDLVFCNSRVVDEDAGQVTVRRADRFRSLAPPGYWHALCPEPTERWSVLPRYPLRSYVAHHPAGPTVTTLKRDLYLSLGGFDASFRGSSAENFEFELRLLRRARVGLVWQPLATIVRYGGNASADASKMAMDLVECLRFALARHELSPEEAAALASELQARLPVAIHGAYLLRDFAALRAYRSLATQQLDLKSRIKCAIAALPAPIARICATLLTRPGIAREGHAAR